MAHQKKSIEYADKRTNQANDFSLLRRREYLLPISGILIFTALLYARSLSNEILSWDDMWHITYNRDIQSLSFINLKAIFTSFYSGMYQPLVTLSFALEYTFFGLNPSIYHTTNVLFHLANIILVFFFIHQMTGSRIPAFTAACLFGIHPMHVESVAWITERKDVMFFFFYFLALVFYVRFSKEEKNKYYFLTLLFYFCSLLSKATAVTLPAILILIDYYLQKKKKTIHLKNKIPFFLLAIVFTLVSFTSQRDNLQNNILQMFNIVDRIFLVSYATCYYLIHVVVPLDLSVFHSMPHKIDSHLPLQYYLAIIPLCLLTLALLRKSSFRHELMFGMLFFLIALLPNIHIIPFGKAIVSERYAYLSYIGIYFIIGQALYFLISHYKNIYDQWRPWIWIMPALVVGWYGYITYQRVGIWHDTQTLFDDASTKAKNKLEANELKAMGNDLNAEERTNAQDYRAAIFFYDKAIALNPTNAKSFHNRGYARHLLEDFEGAMKDYSKAIELDPLYVRAYANRAVIYLKWNKLQEACADLRAAYNLGLHNIFEVVPINCQ